MFTSTMSQKQQQEGSRPRTVYCQREGTSQPPKTDQSAQLLAMLSMCRLCMTTTGTNMKDIFAGGQASFAKKLVEIVNFEVKDGDGFPPQICHRCSLQLNSAFSFKRRCMDSHQKIADIIFWTRDVCKQEAKEDDDEDSPMSFRVRSLGVTPPPAAPRVRPPPAADRSLPVASMQRLGARLTFVKSPVVVPPPREAPPPPRPAPLRSYHTGGRPVGVAGPRATSDARQNGGFDPPKVASESRAFFAPLGESFDGSDAETLGALGSLQCKEDPSEDENPPLGYMTDENLPRGHATDENLPLDPTGLDVKPEPDSENHPPFSYVGVKEEEESACEPPPPAPEPKFSPPPPDHDYCAVPKADPDGNHPSVPLQPPPRRRPRKSDLTGYKTCEVTTKMSHFLTSRGFRQLLKISQPKRPRKKASKPALGQSSASITACIETTVVKSREWAEKTAPPSLDALPAEFVTGGITPENPNQTDDDIADLDMSLFTSEEFLAVEAELMGDKKRQRAKRSRKAKGESEPKRRQADKRARKERPKKVRERKERPKKERPKKERPKKERPKEVREPKTLTCVHCSRQFEKVLYLNTHLRHHCGPNKRDTKCNLCGVTFGTFQKLDVHLTAEHPGGLNFTCGQCGMAFRRNGSLLHHVNRRHTRERMFLCSVCGKMFGRPYELAEHHRARHSGERPHVCGQCGKTFTLHGLLRSHQRTHVAANAFNCAHCGKNFRNKQTLVHHIYAHIGRRPHRCRYCRKSFCHSSDVTKHERVHTGEHPYRCGPCGKAFTQRWYLRKHPCPERDRLEAQSQSSQPANKESQSSQPANEEGILSQTTNEDCQSSQDTNEKGILSQTTNEEGILSQTTNEDSQSSQPTNEEGILSQTTNEEGILSQTTNKERILSQTTNEESQSSQPTNEESQSSQPTNEESQSSQPSNEEEDLSSQPSDEEGVLSQPFNEEGFSSQASNEEGHNLCHNLNSQDVVQN